MLGLICGTWDLSSLPRIESRPLAVGAQSLNHWTTSEVAKDHFIILQLLRWFSQVNFIITFLLAYLVNKRMNGSGHWEWWLLTSKKRHPDTLCPMVGAHTTTCEVVLPQIEPESDYTSRSNSSFIASRNTLNASTEISSANSRLQNPLQDKWGEERRYTGGTCWSMQT